VAALAGEENVTAKIRTGGVKEEMIPSVEQVAGFIGACSAGRVPFKATAGLHHALRGEYALTYETGSERGTMHGFLNVFLLSCFAYTGLMSQDEAEALLEERDAKSMVFDEAGASWRARRLTLEQIESARKQFLLSFGSCSFTEPLDDLRGMGLMGSE
ncbi:MAG: hypothetical protein VYC34_01700, partial [Planctomycetota bacterium]|nr:hypothetical protein [Planctomycetota bacterium]